jgi:hypothetical protein
LGRARRRLLQNRFNRNQKVGSFQKELAPGEKVSEELSVGVTVERNYERELVVTSDSFRSNGRSDQVDHVSDLFVREGGG